MIVPAKPDLNRTWLWFGDIVHYLMTLNKGLYFKINYLMTLDKGLYFQIKCTWKLSPFLCLLQHHVFPSNVICLLHPPCEVWKICWTWLFFDTWATESIFVTWHYMFGILGFAHLSKKRGIKYTFYSSHSHSQTVAITNQMFQFCFQVNEMCDMLKIHCFSLRPLWSSVLFANTVIN